MPCVHVRNDTDHILHIGWRTTISVAFQNSINPGYSAQYHLAPFVHTIDVRVAEGEGDNGFSREKSEVKRGEFFVTCLAGVTAATIWTLYAMGMFGKRGSPVANIALAGAGLAWTHARQCQPHILLYSFKPKLTDLCTYIICSRITVGGTCHWRGTLHRRDPDDTL